MPKDHAAMLTGVSPALGGLFKMPQGPQLHIGKPSNPQHQGFNEIQSRMLSNNNNGGGGPQQPGQVFRSGPIRATAAFDPQGQFGPSQGSNF
jgi:hypothetical protein